jgi:hypothetical protein
MSDLLKPSIFSPLDEILDRWAQKHALKIQRLFRDDKVRTTTVVSQIGEIFQIWLSPQENGQVRLHAWNYGQTRRDWEVPISQLADALDDALRVVKTWMTPLN